MPGIFVYIWIMKKNKWDITQELIKEYLYYHNGLFYRIKKTYKSVQYGELKLNMSGSGYLDAFIFNKHIGIHRLTFLWFRGWLPEEVDHIDLNKLNNDISNLRAADKAKNAQNRKAKSGKTSKYKGVSLIRKSGKWLATIQIHRKSINLGSFINERSAALKYIQAAKLAYGEFANCKAA